MNNAAINNRIKRLESVLSSVAGKAIEITIRGEKEFTIGFEGTCEAAERRIKMYFKGQVTWTNKTAAYDVECDYTALYMTAK